MTETTRYYHVAGTGYTVREPLLCWDRLEALGSAPDWKWEGADEGFDGDVVCLFDTIDDAREFQATHGGTLLAVDVPETAEGSYDLPWGGVISPRMTQVAEGYPAIRQGIPAEWLTVIE